MKLSAGTHSETGGVGAQSNGSFTADASDATDDAAAGNAKSVASASQITEHLETVKGEQRRRAAATHDGDLDFPENDLNSSLSPKNALLATKKLQRLSSNRKRDLINLQSALSPKYIGYANANSPTPLSDSDDTVRTTRRRVNQAAALNNNNNNASHNKNDNGDVQPRNNVERTESPQTVEGTPLLDRSESKTYMSPIEKLLLKNGASSPKSTGFETDPDDVVPLATRLKLQRKLKRTAKTSPSAEKTEADTATTKMDEKTENATATTEIEEEKVEATLEAETPIEEGADIVMEEQTMEAILENEEPSEMEEKMETNNLQPKEITDDAVIEDTVPINMNVKSECESESGASSCDVDEADSSSPISSLGSEHTQDTLPGEPADTSSKTIESIDEPNNPDSELACALPSAASTGMKSPGDLSPTSFRQPEDNGYMKSPSSVSLDSAKGLSIVTDPGWPTYQVGDLYWGKVFTYCYWPCMVCPDPYGQIVGNPPAHPQRTSTDNAPVPIQVHVRFFADNGRRNWIKPENLLTFAGLKAYEDHREEVRIKHGNRSGKYRTMVPKRSKLEVWRQAIDEAKLVAEVPYPERLEKFYKIYESVVTLNRQKRKRTNSMAQDTSDVGSSLYDSTDNLHAKQHLQLMSVKRERSETPVSPAFSPVKKSQKRTKRRKLSKGAEAETGGSSMPSQAGGSAENNVTTTISEIEEYRHLFDIIQEYVIVHRHDEQVDKVLRAVVDNIWSLKKFQMREKHRELACAAIYLNRELDSAIVQRDRGAGTTQRLSNRLRTLVERRSRTPVVTPSGTPTPNANSGEAVVLERRLSEIPKTKKPVNRPIEEVVDDIFQLDSKYLFRGLNRGSVCKYCYKPGSNLLQCSRTCHSWMHADCLESKKSGLPITKKDGTKLKALEAASSSTSTSTSPSPVPEIEHITGDAPDALATVATPTIEVICYECNIDEDATCCICRQVLPPQYPSPTPGSPLKEPSEAKEPRLVDGTMITCGQNMCGRKFHAGCCKYWPQAIVSSSLTRCPLHVCHTCVSDNPRKFLPVGSSKLTRCVKCSASYHQDSRCIPAGSRMLTTTTLICPRHNVAKTDAHLNVLWCFICVKGGELLCCETCPIAVHSGCRDVPIEKHENYICEECESGRLPLYGEIVWAKFNNFRWWPAIILPPTEIPHNILKKAHGESEFVVRFFGTHDHGWIPRRRVYLYIEGDNGEKLKPKSQLHRKFYNGIEEATRFLKITKARRHEQMVARGIKVNPPPYVKIKMNKAVPPVKFVTNSEEHSTCDCRPEDEHPCGSNSNCLNRMLFNECHPEYCLCGDRCENRMFETRKSPRLDVVYMNDRGFGLVCREPIAEGDFVIEYVGEVINQEEFQRRMLEKQTARDENFYFLGLEKDFIIDAGPKGNLARFMNHSCEPNCTTQKWTVNCSHRVGLFAIKDIPAETELTFNYLWDDLLNDKKKACHCGSERCSGEIGGKLKEKATTLKLKQLQRSRTSAIRIQVPPAKRAKKSVPKVKHVSADDEPQETKKDQ
ncbi:probable histone-lysine N-methyltransferase Mes-4 isoform X1 [Drosophila subobscura]|uniref:probable histone-lysine N-methyltransferase Mes-4 isoform X1 n=1 Tax=Drosophila subobscura TaxID=7241 RepID=UPI00155AB2E0|nr:probable histone-lysine N-methyltransferase Mes-4 isoform X1 [Drosophila subobscura]